ncbi:unnamed protein product [Gadus morhua 'NCC']
MLVLCADDRYQSHDCRALGETPVSPSAPRLPQGPPVSPSAPVSPRPPVSPRAPHLPHGPPVSPAPPSPHGPPVSPAPPRLPQRPPVSPAAPRLPQGPPSPPGPPVSPRAPPSPPAPPVSPSAARVRRRAVAAVIRRAVSCHSPGAATYSHNALGRGRPIKADAPEEDRDPRWEQRSTSSSIRTLQFCRVTFNACL